MTPKEFNAIYNEVARHPNYVAKPFQTMGGMWAIDTFANDEWTVKLMDGGFTRVLIHPATNTTYRMNCNDEIIEIKG